MEASRGHRPDADEQSSAALTPAECAGYVGHLVLCKHLSIIVPGITQKPQGLQRIDLGPRRASALGFALFLPVWHFRAEPGRWRVWEAACHAILRETGLLAQSSGRSYNSSVFALCQRSSVLLSPRDGKSGSGHGQCLPEFPTVLGNKVSLTTGKLVGLVTSGHLSFFSLQYGGECACGGQGTAPAVVAQAPPTSLY